MAYDDDCDVPRLDDPSALGYADWRSLIGRWVFMLAFRTDPVMYQVTDARVTSTTAHLQIREWLSGEQMWVGGCRSGMYSMSRRPDGGFQVAGDKFILIGSRSENMPVSAVIEAFADRVDDTRLRGLAALIAESELANGSSEEHAPA